MSDETMTASEESDAAPVVNANAGQPAEAQTDLPQEGQPIAATVDDPVVEEPEPPVPLAPVPPAPEQVILRETIVMQRPSPDAALAIIAHGREQRATPSFDDLEALVRALCG